MTKVVYVTKKRICVIVVALPLVLVTILLLILSSDHETNKLLSNVLLDLDVQVTIRTIQSEMIIVMMMIPRNIKKTKELSKHQQEQPQQEEELYTGNGTKQIQTQQSQQKKNQNKKQVPIRNGRSGRAVRAVRAIDILNQKYYYNDNINVDYTDNDDDDNNNSNMYSDIEELYITQKLDHFNIANNEYTFQQRYFYSNRYVSTNNVLLSFTSQVAESVVSSDTTININNNNNRTKIRRKVNSISNNNTIRQIAFLCIGGEGPYLDKSVLYNSPHCTGDMLYTANEIMKNHNNTNNNKSSSASSTSNINIHLFALEHRYYGESYPQGPFPNDNDNDNNNNITFSPVSNQHLQYLSSRQALVDIIHFISHPYYSEYEWIVFGSSYPGVLSAWVRYHYPHLIVGSISNSAPILAQLNMIQYNDHVSTVLQNPIVGGSNLCYQIYQKGHEQLVYTIQQNSSYIAQLLNVCTSTNNSNSSSSLDNIMNQHLLLGDGIIYPGTQENDPACTDNIYCNIAKKCSILVNYYNDNTTTSTTDFSTTTNGTTNDHREMDSLVYLYNIIQQNEGRQQEQDTSATTASDNYNDKCIIVNWDETIQYISDPIRGQENGLRSWLWQTCTEFGYYQTCETNTNCPYTHGYHLLQQDLDICSIGFNISSNTVIDSINDTNIINGGWTIYQSGINNIASITGSIDPWTELALHKQQGQTNSSNSNTAISTTATATATAMPIYSVIGASHHYWTHPVQITDTSEIIAARTFIYQTVCQFLNI